MERKFKCCKKDFGNLLCITCCDIFHPSCLDRKTKYKELGSFKIYCSQNCELKDAEKKQDADKLVNDIKKLKNDVSQRDETINKLEYEKDEKITELMKRIDELEKDTKEREADYIRARKKKQDFEDEAYETEILYVNKQREHELLISQLQKGINDVKKRNGSLEEELKQKTDEIHKHIRDLESLQEVNAEMLGTIRTLEMNNITYSNEVVSLKNTLTHLQSSKENPIGELTSSTKVSERKKLAFINTPSHSCIRKKY
ncbi:hypothetical protein JTB14_013445 [Gonioctena quinquepunctata]|nr:hypothetical protein JTB14_013445 [Gonioctena quinquepunctata]